MCAWYDLVFQGMTAEHRIEQRYLIPDDERFPTFHEAIGDAVAAALRERERCNVYAGMTWRRPGKRGRREDCTATRVLWVEYDIKHHGGDRAVPLLRLSTFGLPFSAIIWTGGGFYALLGLAERLDLRDAGVQERVVAANKSLARAVGDGVVLDAVHDIPRILRPPGTYNHKYGRPTLVDAVHLDAKRVYGLGEVEDWLARHYHQEHVPPMQTRRAPECSARTPRAEAGSAPGDRPGDQWAAATDWAAILEPHGWTLHRHSGDVERWTRPGKHGAVSATVNYGGYGLLYVFSSNAAPFEPGRGYGKFAAYALLEHDGDYAVAARALAARGYGAPRGKTGAVESSERVYEPIDLTTGQGDGAQRSRRRLCPRRPDLTVLRPYTPNLDGVRAHLYDTEEHPCRRR